MPRARERGWAGGQAAKHTFEFLTASIRNKEHTARVPPREHPSCAGAWLIGLAIEDVESPHVAAYIDELAARTSQPDTAGASHRRYVAPRTPLQVTLEGVRSATQRGVPGPPSRQCHCSCDCRHSARPPGEGCCTSAPRLEQQAGRGRERMPMTLIEGNYEILRAAPDGDSVKFYPKRGKEDWKLIRTGRAVQSNKRGGAQLRLDGIDALETHYNPQGGAINTSHQPLDLGRAASKALLDWLGFSNVERGANETVTAGKPEKIPGYILTRFSDTYGRCVAFAFKGNHPKKTGEDSSSTWTCSSRA